MFVVAWFVAGEPLSCVPPSNVLGSVGCCEKLTGGHRAAWGTRYVKPEPGMLVVFPAHMFHDVVPTQSDAQRIAIGLDAKPAAAS